MNSYPDSETALTSWRDLRAIAFPNSLIALASEHLKIMLKKSTITIMDGHNC